MMHVLRRLFTMRESVSDAGLIPLLTHSRVLKALPVGQPGNQACAPWGTSGLGLLMAFVTAALGLLAWLQSLAPLSLDEAALATYLAVLVSLSWFSAMGLVSAVAWLAALWLSRDRRTTAHQPKSSVTSKAA